MRAEYELPEMITTGPRAAAGGPPFSATRCHECRIHLRPEPAEGLALQCATMASPKAPKYGT